MQTYNFLTAKKNKTEQIEIVKRISDNKRVFDSKLPFTCRDITYVTC